MSTKKAKKIEFMPNAPIDQFIEQSFPVVEKDFGTWTSKRVQVIGYCNPKETYECHFFKVEVVKDYDGFVSFIVKGEGASQTDFKSNSDIWIMRTDDFNKAYDLKMKLSSLLDFKPSKYEKMHCYGSLQREKTMWE